MPGCAPRCAAISPVDTGSLSLTENRGVAVTVMTEDEKEAMPKAKLPGRAGLAFGAEVSISCTEELVGIGDASVEDSATNDVAAGVSAVGAAAGESIVVGAGKAHGVDAGEV